MIERLLAAEGALSRDELDHAQRLYGQVVEADPRNAIAVVGLARVLRRRGDTAAARELLAHALEIDPDEAAARRLLAELDADAAPAPEEAPAPVVPAPAPAPVPAKTGATTSPVQPRGLVAWLRRLFRPG
jgi:thioredoxin-like negative regulator of GroEL